MDHVEVIRTYLDIINSRTLTEQAHTVIHPDVEFRAGTGVEVRGVEDFVAAMLGLIAPMPDIQATLRDHTVSGDTINFTLDMSGTFTGEMKTPDGQTIPGNGNRAEWVSNVEARIKDGKIAHWVTTVDMQDFWSQLGLA